jgi:hypothetical protein
VLLLEEARLAAAAISLFRKFRDTVFVYSF